MTDSDLLQRRHLRLGWWSLLLWLTLGIGLEAAHFWKASWYLAPGHDPRRLLLTLAHAHGTVLALVHLGFAATAARLTRTNLPSPKLLRIASPCLSAAALLLPCGFLLGGAVVYAGGDPGPGIFLVPIGALLLLLGVLLTATAATRDRS